MKWIPLILLVVLAGSAPFAFAADDARSFEITNPLKTDSIEGLIKLVSDSLVDLAIPVAVVLYVWAGVMYLTAGANAGNLAKAKQILTYTSIGLAIIFIGGGFVDLIKSFLNAGQ